MNKATEITQAARTVADVEEAAARAGAIVDALWSYEATAYLLDDKSVIVVHGSKFTPYDTNLAASTAAISEWMSA
jgi:hypothetical protein